MKMHVTRRGGLLAAPVLALALSGLGSTSSAALILTLNGTVFVTDNGAGDSDPVVGRINNTSIIGGFGVAITIVSSNSPGNPSIGSLQVTSLALTNNNATNASLSVQTSDTNFALPGGPLTPMRLDNSAGGTFTSGVIGDSVTFQSFADPFNGQPAAATSSPLGTFSKSTLAATEAFGGTTFANWSRGAGPYSLSNTLTMTLTPGATMNFSGTTAAVAVPEPVSVAFLAGPLATLALRRRSRSR